MRVFAQKGYRDTPGKDVAPEACVNNDTIYTSLDRKEKRSERCIGTRVVTHPGNELSDGTRVEAR